MEIWESKPPGTLWATPGLLRETFTFSLDCVVHLNHINEVTFLDLVGKWNYV